MPWEYIKDYQIKKDLHSQIFRQIISKGQKFDKKHGNWYILWLDKDNFLELDSWNCAIKHKVGSGEYNYWIGFEGKQIQYLGIDFGGFETTATEEGLRYYLSLIK